MKFLSILLFAALIVPVQCTTTSTSTATGDPPAGSDQKEEAKLTERDADRDVGGFDLYDFFLPHFPSAFLLDGRSLFGLERELFRRTSPRYDINYKKDSVVMTVEVPGFASDEIEVEVKSGGRVLSVSAQKESHDEEHAFSSQFYQTFTLDPGAETDKLTANLSDGILTLTAPRHDALPYNRKIPITHLDQQIIDEMTNEKKEDDVAVEKE